MTAATGVTLSLTALRKPLEELQVSAAAPIKKKLKILKTEATLKDIYKAIGSVQKVKTLAYLTRK